MARILKYVVLALIVVLVGGGAYLYFTWNDVLRDGVVAYGPDVFGSEVRLEDVSFQPLGGRAVLTGLAVGNPEGFGEGDAFSFGRIVLDVSPRSILTDHVKINEITVEAPEITVITQGDTSNIETLQANAEKAVGAPEPTAEAPPESDVRVSIGKLSVTDGKVTLDDRAAGLGIMNVNLPNINIEEIGTKEGGVPPEEVATIVMAKILPEVSAALLAATGKQVIGETIAAVDETLEAVEDVAKDLTDEVGDVIDKGLGGLFGKKDEEKSKEDQGN